MFPDIFRNGMEVNFLMDVKLIYCNYSRIDLSLELCNISEENVDNLNSLFFSFRLYFPHYVTSSLALVSLNC